MAKLLNIFKISNYGLLANICDTLKYIVKLFHCKTVPDRPRAVHLRKLYQTTGVVNQVLNKMFQLPDGAMQ